MNNKQVTAICITLIICSTILSLSLFFFNPQIRIYNINKVCYLHASKELVKVWKWKSTGTVVSNERGTDYLEMYLEDSGGNIVQGSEVTLDKVGDEWKHTWTGLEDGEEYTIVYSYRHNKANPETGSGEESKVVGCTTEVVNEIEEEEENV